MQPLTPLRHVVPSVESDRKAGLLRNLQWECARDSCMQCVVHTRGAAMVQGSSTRAPALLLELRAAPVMTRCLVHDSGWRNELAAS